jgi:hypothetical protein
MITATTAGVAAALAFTGALVFAASPAHALSAAASKDNFQGGCDALVIVSDTTSSGNVEAFGGFSCPAGEGLWNHGVPATIKMILIQNGTEVINSVRTLPTCWEFWTCRSESWQVKLPDYAGTDRFRGKMVITSLGGSVTLTTGEIRT